MTAPEGHDTIATVMHSDVIIIRIVFAATLVTTGYFLRPVHTNPWISASVGALVAACIIFCELRIRRATLKTLIGAAVGSILGIVGAFLIGLLIMRQASLHDELKTFLTLALVFFMAYVGLMVGGAKGDHLELSALGGIFSDKSAKRDLKVLDTSVIIDGRIADVAETGFLTGTLIIPQFILRELQQVADSPDSSKDNAAGGVWTCSTGSRTTVRSTFRSLRPTFLQCERST